MFLFTCLVLYGVLTNIVKVSSECTSFTDSNNKCEIVTESNIGIGIGKSSNSGTDSPLIFSYCINKICSPQWYKLDHCDYNDFKGACSYEYFIIPEFDDAISDAVDNQENDFRFEFINCGNDGIQIDEIKIGTKCNQHGKIKFFNRGDHNYCNFDGYGESSFAVDGDDCASVSVSWSGGSSSEATIYSTLIQDIDFDEICNLAKHTHLCASQENDCTVQPVRPISGINDLSFSGDGKYDCDSNGNCEYFFSMGFQSDICDSSNMIDGSSKFGSWLSKTFKISSQRWCAQGLSQYGEYITRVFYEGGDADYTDYIVVSVIKKGKTVRYSNILVAQPDNGKSACHAGGMVLTQIDGVYWFLVACSSWIMVFSEESIEQLYSGYSVNGKKFYYKVSKDNVKCISKGDSDIKLSWISRNQGTNNEFWTGYCDSQELSVIGCNGCNWDVRLRLITLDVHNTWQIIDVVEYSFDPSGYDLTFIQGATRIDNFMYLSKTDLVPALNNWILKCPIDGTQIGACIPVCKLRIGFGLNYIQGAETDDDGNLYIGSEFGPIGRRAPWFILKNLEYDGKVIRECLPDFWNDANLEPFNLPQQKPIVPNMIYTEWGYKQIGLGALFGFVMFTFGMLLMSLKYKSNHKYYDSVKTVSNDEESDAL